MFSDENLKKYFVFVRLLFFIGAIRKRLSVFTCLQNFYGGGFIWIATDDASYFYH